MPWTEADELARLDSHFGRVLRRLHATGAAGLSPAQRRARATHLQRLSQYRERGVFPKNRRFPGRALPIFVDDAGTRCAMGHLIEPAGGRELVSYVATERNTARIAELADIPELLAWLERNGLSADEAAAGGHPVRSRDRTGRACVGRAARLHGGRRLRAGGCLRRRGNVERRLGRREHRRRAEHRRRTELRRRERGAERSPRGRGLRGVPDAGLLGSPRHALTRPRGAKRATRREAVGASVTHVTGPRTREPWRRR